VEELNDGLVYFDTSAWNRLADHPDCERVIASLHERRDVIFGSVYSAGEILKTRDPEGGQWEFDATVQASPGVRRPAVVGEIEVRRAPDAAACAGRAESTLRRRSVERGSGRVVAGGYAAGLRIGKRPFAGSRYSISKGA
jgi:hypothetical protein